MDDVLQGEQPKQGKSKKLIIIILVALLVIGGSVAAYSLFLNKSPKEKFFLSEKASFDFLIDKFEERYKPELDWLEKSEETPTESVITLSAEYNDPFGGGYGAEFMGPEQIINNSKVKITTGTDMKKKQLSANIEGSFGDLEIGDINLYVTDKELSVGLPFLKELLQVKGDDFGTLLHELDPMTFTGEESIDFGVLFDTEGVLPKEDLEYLKKEYGKMIYDAIPDSAFTSTNETVKVSEESVKSEKITLDLSEKEVKEILSAIFKKAAKDDKLQEILKEQYQINEFGLGAGLNVSQEISSVMEEEADSFVDEFVTAMEEAEEGLEDIVIPTFTSTIWIKDDLIVKRDFAVEMGPNKDELVELTIDAEQLLNDKEQTFDYDFGFADEFTDGSMTLTGDLSTKDDKINDSIKLSVAGTELSYEADETLKDSKRDFERVFTISDNGVGGSLIWSGNSTYNKDKMKSEHKLSLESPEISQDMFTLNIGVDGKTVKGIDMPKEDNVKDLGKMSIDELTEYFEMEVAPQFEEWMYDILGAGSW